MKKQFTLKKIIKEEIAEGKIRKEFISVFEKMLPSICPIARKKIGNNIFMPIGGDGAVYFEIGAHINKLPKNLQFFYDNLDETEKDDVDEELMIKFATKYQLEW